MNFDLNLGQYIVIALSALLLIWYFWANAANRKRGMETYRWLREGLESVGKLSDAEWIGASNMGARLTVKKAKQPFRRVETHYLLEPREFPPYWLFSRLRGKREEVVIKVHLRSAPKGGFEIRRLTGRQNPKTESNLLILSGGKFQINANDQQVEGVMESVEAFLQQHSNSIEAIILQPVAPHLVLHARLVPTIHTSAVSYFNAIQSWFQEN